MVCCQRFCAPAVAAGAAQRRQPLEVPRHLPVRFDQRGRPAGDVVEQDREARGVGHLREVGDQPPLGRAAVVRGHHQRGVDARLLGLPGELDGLLRVVRPGPGDDRSPALRHLDHGPVEVELLPVPKRGGLAGRARHHQALGAGVEQVPREGLGPVEVERVVVVERRDHRRDHRAESGHRDPLSSWCAGLPAILAPVRIYTRTGDDGTTGLFYGGRVPKSDPAPEAYGSVDEAVAAASWWATVLLPITGSALWRPCWASCPRALRA